MQQATNRPKHMRYWHLKDVKGKSKDSWAPDIQLSAGQKYPPVPIQIVPKFEPARYLHTGSESWTNLHFPSPGQAVPQFGMKQR